MAVNETKLEEFLRELTLSSIARNADGIENVAEVLYTIDAAVRSRRIVDCVQFEESWEKSWTANHTPTASSISSCRQRSARPLLKKTWRSMN